MWGFNLLKEGETRIKLQFVSEVQKILARFLRKDISHRLRNLENILISVFISLESYSGAISKVTNGLVS